MIRKTKKSAREVRTAIGVSRDSGGLAAVFRDLPEDIVGEVLRHLPAGTARLVSKRQRDSRDSARTRLEVWGLGRHGQPALVARQCPNLMHLTIRVKSYHLTEAYMNDLRPLGLVGQPSAADLDMSDFRYTCIEWETYVEQLTEGLSAWADACSSLHHLRHLHLDIEPVLYTLPPATERALAERFFRLPGLREVSLGDWGRIHQLPSLYRLPVAEFWKERGPELWDSLGVPKRSRPIIDLLSLALDGRVQPIPLAGEGPRSPKI